MELMSQWLLIFLLFFGCTRITSPLPSADSGEAQQIDTVIESVDALILESFPMQLNLQVTGYQPDGCEFPVQVEQSIEGDTITVHIFREIPADTGCPAVIVPYDANIAIEGSFTEGVYTIIVNNFTTEVDFGSSGAGSMPIAVSSTTTVVVESVVPVVQTAAPAAITVIITQTRSGNHIAIVIARDVSNLNCPVGQNPFELTIGLEWLFMEGAYTIDVNGIATTTFVA